jgi:hypothetical protein
MIPAESSCNSLSEQASSISEIVGSILEIFIWKESVNVLPNVVGFRRVLQFPSTRNVESGLRLSTFTPTWAFFLPQKNITALEVELS